MRTRNVGFRMSATALGRERVCELLDISEPTYYKILSGEINLRLEYAAKLFDNTGKAIKWNHFRQWEENNKDKGLISEDNKAIV